MEENKTNINSFHLAGVIPVAGQKLDFNFPWHDCCTPIAQDYLAIERSVVECAYAGCETIWIVCNDDMQPLIRHRLGDYVQDPVWVSRTMSPRSSDRKKVIPIFYTPIHPKDRDKRDCLSWSVLHGAQTAYHISSGISKWVAPDRYYVSFPYGVYLPEVLQEHRKEISSDQGFFLSFENKTVRDGEYLGFTFSPKDFIRIRKLFRKNATGKFITPKEGLPRKMLPMEERYSARYFSVEDVFKHMSLNSCKVLPVWEYSRIDSWDNYRAYMCLKQSDMIRRPSRLILNYHELGPIGRDSNYLLETEE